MIAILLLFAVASEGLALSLSRPGLISPAMHGSRAARVVLMTQLPEQTLETSVMSAAKEPPATSAMPEVHMEDKAPAETAPVTASTNAPAASAPAETAPVTASTNAPAASAPAETALATGSTDAPAAPEPFRSPFTLEKRGDGWDDLRAAIIVAREERRASYDAMQKKYVKPVSRAAKVLVDEVVEAIPVKDVPKAVMAPPPAPKAVMAPPPAPKAVFAPAPAAPAAPREAQTAAPAAKPKPAVLSDKTAAQAVSWLATLLDDAAATNQKKKAAAPAAPKKKELKKPSSKDISVATFNLVVLLSVPTLTLTGLTYLFVDTVLK